MTIKNVRPLMLLVACLSLAACSGGSSNSRIDYKQAKTLPSLEVPPDLEEPIDTGSDEIPGVPGTAAKNGTASASASTVLPLAEGIHIAHDGSTRWLVIDSNADKLWPKLRRFWGSLGLEIKLNEQAMGIMETQWAENRADTPTGFFADLVKKVFKNAYSAGTLDKYRLRLEPIGDNRTELYITHYGLKEVAPQNQSGDIVETRWEIRPSDPELANEVLNRLVLFLGGSKTIAKAVLAKPQPQPMMKSRLDGEMLVVEEGFSRTWRLTGLALDRIGLVVEDRNRSSGVYYVSRIDLLADAGVKKKEGWFGSLFSSDGNNADESKKQLQIRLDGDDTSTRITVRDEQGGAVPEEMAVAVLKRLQESFE